MIWSRPFTVDAGDTEAGDSEANDTNSAATGRAGIGILAAEDPLVRDDLFTGPEDAVIGGNLRENDAIGSIFLPLEIVSSPSFGYLLQFDGNQEGYFLYLPNQDFFGTDVFSYGVTDESGVTTVATVTFVITEENDAPEDFALSANVVAENRPFGSVVGTLSATDPNGDAITYSIVGPAGPFAIAGNQLRVNGPLDHETVPSIPLTLIATDIHGAGTLLKTTITVTDVAEPPPGEGFRFSNDSVGRGRDQAGPEVSSGYSIVRETLDFGSGPFERLIIENTGVWNSIKNLAGPLEGWTPDFPAIIEVNNFVDVRLDLADAPAPDGGVSFERQDIALFGVKRGSLALGDNDDFVSVFFHSNEAGWNNTVTVHTGDGLNEVYGSSIADLPYWGQDPLPDNADPSNGPLWNPDYDGRFSRLEVYGGFGTDFIRVTGKVTLIAFGGDGYSDSLWGADGNDMLDGGRGDDFLFGGAGRDTFVVHAGDVDTIEDFEGVGDAPGDVILLAGLPYGTTMGYFEGKYSFYAELEGLPVVEFFAAEGLVFGTDVLFV